MVLKDFNLFFPETLKETEHLLKKLNNAVILAGGTFSLPLFKKSLKIPPDIISLAKISDLGYVKVNRKSIRIGSMVTLSDCAHDPVLKEILPAFCESIQNIATPQIRNRATLGGNICSCLPWADLLSILLALDASLNFGVKVIAMRDFLKSPKTVLKNRILRDVVIPFKSIKKFILIRMPRLNSTDIPLCAACIVETSDTVVLTANIGNAYPCRFGELEKYLKEGSKDNEENIDELIDRELAFQKDDYRKAMIKVCLKRVVEQYERTQH